MRGRARAKAKRRRGLKLYYYYYIYFLSCIISVGSGFCHLVKQIISQTLPEGGHSVLVRHGNTINVARVTFKSF